MTYALSPTNPAMVYQDPMALRRSRAQSNYQQLDLAARIESSSAVGLVALLYDELALALNVAHRAWESGRETMRNEQMGKARTILLSLVGSLDFERGGELSSVLADAYNAMLTSMRQAEVKNDIKYLESVMDGLSEMQASWNQIMRGNSAG